MTSTFTFLPKFFHPFLLRERLTSSEGYKSIAASRKIEIPVAST
jgi:hypothetical protein